MYLVLDHHQMYTPGDVTPNIDISKHLQNNDFEKLNTELSDKKKTQRR
jgi:hypothetical protein